MNDRILLSRIALYAYHGVLPEESRIGQRFFISLDCRLDLREAGLNDDLGSSVSYADLAKLASRIGTERRFRTIEALAETVAAEILVRFERVDEVTVTVEKPGAPVPAILDGIAVVITRGREA